MKKLLKIKLLVSLILALYFKIRDSIVIGGFACGLRPYNCSFFQFIIQIIVWFAVIFLALFLIIWGVKTFFKKKFSKNKKSGKGKKKRSSKKEKTSKKETSKEKEEKNDEKEQPEKNKDQEKEEIIDI